MLAGTECKEFPKDGKFDSDKCAMLRSATRATALTCNEEMTALRTECGKKNNEKNRECPCFTTSRYFICESFFEPTRLRYYDCLLFEFYVAKDMEADITPDVRTHCQHEFNLIERTHTSCKKSPDSKPSALVCEIIPDEPDKLSCDELAVYVEFLGTSSAKNVETCGDKVKAYGSAVEACTATPSSFRLLGC